MNSLSFLAVYAVVALAALGFAAAAVHRGACRRQERVREYRRVVRARLRARQERWLESLCEPGDANARVRSIA